ncbi:MAG: hypothetical protein E7673_07595 [Ruminococcaceae bacterium]|nr:hypothetical protein [Oscillospiraceae bacterium]
MAKKTVSHELRVRVTKPKILDMINEIKEQGHYASANAMLNDALERGLPYISGKKTPEVNANTREIVKKVSEAVSAQLSDFEYKMLFNMKKIQVLQTIQEQMLGSFIQEFEFFLQTNGIRLDKALLEKFKESLPERFESDKQAYINQLLSASKKEDK